MEFLKAQASIEKTISALDMPEVKDFMREFAPAYELSLDEVTK